MRENKTLESSVDILKYNASSLTASFEFTATLAGEVKNLKEAQESTADDLEAVKEVAEELQDDVDDLRNEHDSLAIDHDVLAGDVTYDRERRESKENEFDDKMYQFSKEVEEVRDHVDGTADDLRREWEEQNEEQNEATNEAALDYVNEEFAAEMDDQNVNIHKVQNDLANQQDQLDEVNEKMAQALAFQNEWNMREAEHWTGWAWSDEFPLSIMRSVDDQ